MKKALSFASLAFAASLLPLALGAEVIGTLEVSNPSTFDRPDAQVRIDLEQLGLDNPTATVPMLDDEVLVHQLINLDADCEPEQMLLLVDLAAGEVVDIKLVEDASLAASLDQPSRVQAELSIAVGGVWEQGKEAGKKERGDWEYKNRSGFKNVEELVVPDKHSDHSNFLRYEGPGIETDQVGYRFYLDWRNGFDIWGKATPDLVLQDVGQDGFESYHEPGSWGQDILKVGDAVGIGGFGYWDGERIHRVSDTDRLSWKLLSNGPVRASMKTCYDGWQVNDEQLNLTAELAMVAGSRLSEVTLTVDNDWNRIATGIVKHEGVELIQGELDIPGNKYTYLATWGKQSLDGKDLGMAVFVKRQDLEQFTEDDLQYVALVDIRAQQAHYYFAAAWAGEPGGITGKEAFVEYLEQTAERLTRKTRTRLSLAEAEAAKEEAGFSESALEWSGRMAQSVRERRGDNLSHGSFDPEARRHARWTYTTGLMSLALYKYATAAEDECMLKYARSIPASFIGEDGSIATYKMSDFNIDKINSGKMLFKLYQDTGDERFRKAADILRAQLKDHPKTSQGAFWHKKRYPWQVWLDGVYMGSPFYAEYVKEFGAPEDFDHVVEEFLVVEEHLRDPEDGLYYHGWDESREQSWADKTTGLNQEKWARGLGWFSMALVDTLDYLPEDHPGRQDLVRILQDLAKALVRVQDADTGVWYQVLNKPDAVGNYLEASASSMYTYALAKGIRQGYLPQSLIPKVEKAYEGLIREFVQINQDDSIELQDNCQVAGLGYGRDGDYDYYMDEPVVNNDPKGVGPFIMAGVEVGSLIQ